MSIEELPDPGSGHHPDGSPWTTVVLSLGIGLVLGMAVMLAIGPQLISPPSPLPIESPVIARASRSPASPRATPIPANGFGLGLDAGLRQSTSVDDVSFSFSVPADGWAWYPGLYISKSQRPPQGAEAMIFWARHPAGQNARACGSKTAASVRYTTAEVAQDLATGLPGTELVSGPSDVTVGGLPATQVVLFVRDDYSCGPGYFYTWDGEDSRTGPLWGSPLLGDTITIWVMDVDSERFIIAAETHLNASTALAEEVQQIVDSIEFEAPEVHSVNGDYTPGRHSTTVDSTRFSFAIATSGWEPYPDGGGVLGSIHLSKSISGPQGAEEMIYWAGYPNGGEHVPCGDLGGSARPTSALGVATLVASAPGTALTTAPERVSIGGHAAYRTVVMVQAALGCDPGFFFSWTPLRGGALWTETAVGDTIRVWVVEVDGGLFFIGAVTKPDAEGSEAEIQQIIDSIEFD